MAESWETFLLSGLSPSWRAVVGQEALAGLASLGARLDSTAQLETLEPPTHRVMRAFELEPENVRVIIIGQDPYPGSGMASGLAFSVNPDVTALPASLKNIRAELSSDLGITLPPHGDLSLWSSRGVLLLNRHLTTERGKTGAHHRLGWGDFTRAVVRGIAHSGRHCVVVLWGREAQKLAEDCGDLPIVASAHPSPLSARRGFLGSRPFSRVNHLLEKGGQAPLDWSLGEGS